MRNLLVLCGSVLALVVAPGVALAESVPSPTHAPLPASLVALEQKQEELKVTSMRFSAQTSIAVPRSGHKLLSFLKVLGDSRTSGEVTISPPSGNVTFTLFGHPFKMRVVDGASYLYLTGRGRRHHRRVHIWIKLGPGGILELLTVNGKHIKAPKTAPPKEPVLSEPSFAELRKVLAGAEEVREVGAGTVFGQPVTNFLAILEPAQLEREHLASTSRLRPPPTQPPTVTLETSLAQNGLPVRTVITAHDKGTVVTATLDIPAINFPLVVEAPPASQTISIARLQKLERQARRRHHAKRKK